MKKVFANWTYTPKDYFKEEIKIDENDYSLKIFEGTVELVIKNVEDNDAAETHSKYSEFIESFFMNELFKKRYLYEIKPSTLNSKNDDGSVTIYLKPKRNSISVTFSSEVTWTKYDKDGNVITDSEEEKKKKQIDLLKKLQNALNKDELIKGLFESFKNSIKDPDNELVHLYEIRDAIQVHFGSKKNAVTELKITTKEWSDIGRLCNELPLLQGRHRGQKRAQIRNASRDELKLARELSLKLIESCIEYFNSNIN